MNHEEVVHQVCEIVTRAIPPDSGATVESLLVDLMTVLAPVGFDPITAVEIHDDDPPFSDNVVPLHPRLH